MVSQVSFPFSDRLIEQPRNVLREMLRLTRQPEVISFAGGLPSNDMMPYEALRLLAANATFPPPSESCQYGETVGDSRLREYLAAGHGVDVENVLITTGAQQALDLIGRALVNQSDAIVFEEPTYPGALMAWRPLFPKMIGVPIDAQGIEIDRLEAVLQTVKPKFLYVMPRFQNPTGAVLSQSRCHALVRLVREHDLFVVEDNPYEELFYDGNGECRGPSILELFENERIAYRLISVGTFSKVISPGLRIGWVIAARKVIDALVKLKQAMDLHTSTWCQAMVVEFLSAGYLPEHIEKLRRAYGQRRDAMLDALSRYCPVGCQWNQPAGGMFIYGQLPASLSATACLAAAMKSGVAFAPEPAFNVSTQADRSLRLNFTHASLDEIESGIARLGNVISAQLSKI